MFKMQVEPHSAGKWTFSGVSLTFSPGWQLVFTGGKTIRTERLQKKNFPLDGQTRWEKLSLHAVSA